LSTNTIDTADISVLSDDNNRISSNQQPDDIINHVQIKIEDESDSENEQQEEPTLISEPSAPRKK
jgi:hypothetical protein